MNYSEVISIFKGQLSLLGKRLRDKDGKTLFKDVTTSSMEDTYLHEQIDEGFMKFVSLCPNLVGDVSFDSTGITYTFKNPRDSHAIDAALKHYLSSHILYEYVSVAYPNLSQKAANDVTYRLNTLLGVALHKDSYDSNTDFGSVKGEVILERG